MVSKFTPVCTRDCSVGLRSCSRMSQITNTKSNIINQSPELPCTLQAHNSQLRQSLCHALRIIVLFFNMFFWLFLLKENEMGSKGFSPRVIQDLVFVKVRFFLIDSPSQCQGFYPKASLTLRQGDLTDKEVVLL